MKDTKETSQQNKSSQTKENNYSNNFANRVFRRSSFRKFLIRIAHHVSSVGIGANKHASTNTKISSRSANNNMSSDRVPPIGGYQWPPDQTPGVTGLKNHGNTCFMNAVLQCLSHTDILAEYFVLDQYKADLKRRNKINSKKFGTKGELTEQLANVLKALWTCKNETDHSTSFKAVVDRYGTQFRSSTQHDAQEFLFWLLDKVHEDLNTASKRRYKNVKNNYGRPDEIIAAETLANHIRCNNSFVQAIFQAQFRSSLTCPRCKKQSNTFDPFHCISVQLPQLALQTIYVTVLYVKQHPRQVKLGLTVPSGSPIVALRERLHADTGIATKQMVLADINETGFSRVFYDSQPIGTLKEINTIYCIEIPEIKDDNSTDLMLLIANVRKYEDGCDVKRFGTPFCLKVNRDCSYVELQKKLLKEISSIVKPEVFAYATPLSEMFQMRLQDPSADPDTYLEQVEHPLFMEIIDMALSVLSSDAGPAHIKLLLEWNNPEIFFSDLTDVVVEHESVSIMRAKKTNEASLTLEQCLEHYTKAEMLSAEDAWRCPNCQQYLPVVKTLGLWSLPEILVVHFKRFRQQHQKGPESAKLTTMVLFPLDSFDMSPHLARVSASAIASSSSNAKPPTTLTSNEEHRNSFSSPWRKSFNFRSNHHNYSNQNHYKNKERDQMNKDNRYDLYAVCYHQGDTLETGHYTAACKNPYDHHWYKFDDQKVTQVQSDKIQDEIVNNEAYILFYQRRKTESLECSSSNSITSSDHWVARIAPSIETEPSVVSTISNSINNLVYEKSINTNSEIAIDLQNNNETNKIKTNTKKDSDLSNSNLKEPTLNPPIQNQPNNDFNEIIDTINKNVVNEEETIEVENLEILKTDEKFINEQLAFNIDEKPSNMLEDKCIESKTIASPVVEKAIETKTICNINKVNCNIKNSRLCKPVDNYLANPKLLNEKLSIIKDLDAITIETNKTNLSVLSDKLKEESLKPISTTIIKPTNKKCPSSEAIPPQRLSIGGSSISGYCSGAVNIKEVLSTSLRSNQSGASGFLDTSSFGSNNCVNLRHSFSNCSSNYKLKDCETISLLRNNPTANSCSKDTLMFIDQQGHNLIDNDETSFLGSRSLWISPVTPHKLITVSPKN